MLSWKAPGFPASGNGKCSFAGDLVWIVAMRGSVEDRSVIQRPDTEALDRGAIHDYGNPALSD